jgi:NADH-quinone oxidoreductase subunit G
LATASFAESDGTFINQEGRAQRYYKAIFGENDPPPAWELLRDAGIAAGRLLAGQWETHGGMLAAIGVAVPELAPFALASPPVDATRPATLPHRHSGRTAAQAHLHVREPAPPAHADSPLGTTMEGPPIHLQDLAPVLWSPGWNSVQAVNKVAPGGQDVFLFEESVAEVGQFETPPPAPPANRVLGEEELSNYAPAIIARNQTP